MLPAIAAGILVLIVALWLRPGPLRPQHAATATVSELHDSASAPLSGRQDAISTIQVEEPAATKNAGADRAQQRPSTAAAPELRGGATMQSAAAIESASGADGNTLAVDRVTQQDPDAVVGRAFPVSASVEEWRKQCVAELGEIDVCNYEHDLLKSFAKERRDNAWARETESRLRNHVLTSDGGNKYQLRAVECRTTLCALEVESQYGGYHGMTYPESEAIGLRDRGGHGGYETIASGVRITVTLYIFARR
jgi:hypothetical protein